jgi:hypothetical protein
MTESGGPEGLTLSMSIVGYEIVYVRQVGGSEPSRPRYQGCK